MIFCTYRPTLDDLCFYAQVAESTDEGGSRLYVHSKRGSQYYIGQGKAESSRDTVYRRHNP